MKKILMIATMSVMVSIIMHKIIFDKKINSIQITKENDAKVIRNEQGLKVVQLNGKQWVLEDFPIYDSGDYLKVAPNSQSNYSTQIHSMKAWVEKK